MYSVSENILRFLRSNGPSSRAAVWAEFGMGQYKQTDACIKDLIAQNLLSCEKSLGLPRLPLRCPLAHSRRIRSFRRT